MDDNGERKNATEKERIIDIICLVASYVILFLLPEKTGLFFYLIFGVSAFLFCIGFFRLGLTFDTPSNSKREQSGRLIYAILGILINITALYTIYHDQGSGRSIMIATLLLIETLVLLDMAGSGFQTPEYHRLSAIVFRAAAIFMIIFGAAFVILNHFTEPSVVLSTMLLIESICLWKMPFGVTPYRAVNSEIQSVPGLRTPIKELQQTFAGVKTQLGHPWVGKVKTIKQDSIIYGPSEDGFVIYGYYLFGRFYVAGSAEPIFPHPEDAKGHVVEEIPDSNGILLSKEQLTQAYVNMFARYAKNGKAKWISDLMR